MTSGLQAIAEVLALRFLDSLAEGTAICLVTALALRLAPRQNARTRFAVWFTALVAIAALPWMSGWPHTGIAAAATHRAPITLPDSWALYALAFWGTVAAWFCLGVVRALWHLNVLRKNSTPVDSAELDPTVVETLRRHAGKRAILLCTSERVRVPTAVGLVKPRILVPGWVLRELSAAELNQVLLHELAHFGRWDDWTNLGQQVMKAVFFFHPAVWWIDKRVAIEREMACDEVVVAETRSPRAYAECLVHLAERSLVRRGIALAQAALGKVRQTSDRIAELLDVNRRAPVSRSWGAAASLVAVLGLGCGAFYARAPKLVAFGNSPHANGIAERSVVPIVPITQAKMSMPVTQVNLKPKTVARRTLNPQQALALRVESPKRQDQDLVHLTGSSPATVPFTETFLVVVESQGPTAAAPPVYQIQMWRVTVLRTVVTVPSRQFPRNET